MCGCGRAVRDGTGGLRCWAWAAGYECRNRPVQASSTRGDMCGFGFSGTGTINPNYPQKFRVLRFKTQTGCGLCGFGFFGFGCGFFGFG
jgi:hypothetical protein